MEQDIGKTALLFLIGVSIVHLACVDHEGIVFIQGELFAIDMVAHFSFQNMYPFDVVMPVAKGAHIWKSGQTYRVNMKRDVRAFIRYDF